MCQIQLFGYMLLYFCGYLTLNLDIPTEAKRSHGQGSPFFMDTREPGYYAKRAGMAKDFWDFLNPLSK